MLVLAFVIPLVSQLLGSEPESRLCLETATRTDPTPFRRPATRSIPVGGLFRASEAVTNGPRLTAGGTLPPLLSESFDGVFPTPPWSITTGPGCRIGWGPTSCSARTGANSLYIAGRIDNPNCAVLDPCTGNSYPASEETWAIAGPYDLKAYSSGSAFFEFYHRTQITDGTFFWGVSKDCVNFHGFDTGGNHGPGYIPESINLHNVPGLGDVTQDVFVCIGFYFQSDSGPGAFEGIFVDDVSVGRGDPDLVPGFPVQTFEDAGSYSAGAVIHTLVGDIDGDGRLEVVTTSTAVGPVYAWKDDGTLQPGWPPLDVAGVGYPAMGQLSSAGPGFEVISGQFGSAAPIVARSGNGVALPGWPRASANYVSSPPALADVDGDGLDEVFIDEQDHAVHGYRFDGTVLPGWPVGFASAQRVMTPAIADLDGDGQIEIVAASSSSSSGSVLTALHADGSTVPGFPVNFNGNILTFPTIGDVDGDGSLELVVTGPSGYDTQVLVFSRDGSLESSFIAPGFHDYGTAQALADMDCDRTPEIILQTDGSLSVWRADGSPLPGWPVSLGGAFAQSAPVVGDVNGDRLPDIVITNSAPWFDQLAEVRAYDRNGLLLQNFPKLLRLGASGAPAIADMDLDGRNEILIRADYWAGYPGLYDTVWAYDLGGGPHGPVHWGQFGGDPRHQSAYEPPYSACVDVDSDCACDGVDNCVGDPNPDQSDSDTDGMGDRCDSDDDEDGIRDGSDNCPLVVNVAQSDGDGDGQGDQCDLCWQDSENDTDHDGFCAELDTCPSLANAAQDDTDGDGIGNPCDLCPAAPDAVQSDDDQDRVGDSCDNCPAVSNPSQSDSDGIGEGDVCDLTITAPLAGEVTCASSPPAIQWTPEIYDRFRVFVSSDPAFKNKKRITSGNSLLKSTSWSVPPKKWSSVCSKAGSQLYMRVLGKVAVTKQTEFSEVVILTAH